MSNIWDTFAADESVAQTGVVFDLDGMFSFEIASGPHTGKHVTAFHLKYMGMNFEYERYKKALVKPHRRAIDKDKLDPEIELDIMIKAFCKCILVGWENLPVRENFDALVAAGSLPVIPYTFDAACDAMKAAPELYKLLVDLAEDPQNFGEDTVEEIKKQGNASAVDLTGNLLSPPAIPQAEGE